MVQPEVTISRAYTYTRVYIILSLSGNLIHAVWVFILSVFQY